jgi:hypothetical protein
MPDERSNRLAVGAGGLFEPLDNRDPLLFASIEPSLPLQACSAKWSHSDF